MLQQGYKTCKNGHNYEAGLTDCPFCPSADMTLSGAKTMVEGGVDDRDKTIVDISAPRLTPAGSMPQPGNADKTMIYAPAAKAEQAPVAGIRKLVGWLVTYDISPAGNDFKLYVGRHKIGRNPSCDILIQQPGISDEHAVLLYRDEKFILQDMLSTNGTFVNDEAIDDKLVLKNDDIIKIGNIKLKLKII